MCVYVMEMLSVLFTSNYLKRVLLCFSSDADPSENKPEGYSDGELKDKKCTICCHVVTTDSQLQKHLREHESNDKVNEDNRQP